MNRISILTVFLLAAVSISARPKMRVGIEGSYNANRDSTSSNYVNYQGDMDVYRRMETEKHTVVSPYFAIFPSEKIELSVGLSFGAVYNHIETIVNDTDSWYEKFDAALYGAQLGVQAHVVRKDFFHLSTGGKFSWLIQDIPTVDTDVQNITEDELAEFRKNSFTLVAPLNCDFHIGKVFGIRLTFELFSMGVDIKEYKSGVNDKNYHYSIMGTSLNNEYGTQQIAGLIPTAGFFWRF